MSMYLEYLRERTDDELVESEYGFATYRFVEDGAAVYIVDIFVRPEYREKGIAGQMADEIAKIAKDKGCRAMIGTTQPSAKGSTVSLQALIGYGMRLQSCGVDCIIMRKDL